MSVQFCFKRLGIPRVVGLLLFAFFALASDPAAQGAGGQPHYYYCTAIVGSVSYVSDVFTGKAEFSEGTETGKYAFKYTTAWWAHVQAVYGNASAAGCIYAGDSDAELKQNREVGLLSLHGQVPNNRTVLVHWTPSPEKAPTAKKKHGKTMYSWCWDADTYDAGRTFFTNVFEVDVVTVPIYSPTVGNIGTAYQRYLSSQYQSASGFGVGQCGLYASRQEAQGRLDSQRVPGGRDKIIVTEWTYSDR